MFLLTKSAARKKVRKQNGVNYLVFSCPQVFRASSNALLLISFAYSSAGIPFMYASTASRQASAP